MDSRPTLALALLRAADWFDEALRERLAGSAGVELTRPQAHVFAALDPDGSSVAALARRVGVTRQSMHRTVGELVALGVLTATADPRDRRAHRVRLTGRGADLVTHALEELRAVEAELARRIGDDAVAAMRDALDADWGSPPRPDDLGRR